MTEDLIRYDILAQDALRGVIRKVLSEVSRSGLPGNHHFFITFMTGASGVRISSRLRSKYPEQMTIVIQNQFWDLEISEAGFEVTLTFNDTPEKLAIPYTAVRGFYDPSVNFELEFEVKTEENVPFEPLHIVHQEEEISEPIALIPVKVKQKAQDEGIGGTFEEEKSSADVVSLDAFRKK
jgi:uncharacterized protein